MKKGLFIVVAIVVCTALTLFTRYGYDNIMIYIIDDTEVSGDIKNPVNQNAHDVSIIELIGNPSKYHKKIVRAIGIGNLEFEGDSIYVTRDDWKYMTRNSLWIDLGPQATPYQEARQWNGKYVLVEGTFDMYNKGHFGLYCGAIVDVTRYELRELPELTRE